MTKEIKTTSFWILSMVLLVFFSFFFTFKSLMVELNMGVFFCLDFFSSLLTIQTACLCTKDKLLQLKHDQKLYRYMGRFSCFIFLTVNNKTAVNNETVMYVLETIYVAVEGANSLTKVVWVYILYHYNVLWNNVLI